MAEKRRASGRTRDAKRRRTSTKAATPKDATPQEATPAVEEVVREATPLPNKVVESKPLPTLSERQPLDLSNDEYKTIAESGVLLASLERSRQKWISGNFFDKYWTKTSGRKDAPPAPAGNPHKSWMKEIGPCTLVVEPLIFEATAYYVKEPGPAPAPSHAAPVQQHFPHQQYQHQYQHAPPQQYNQQQRPNPNAPAGSPYGAPYSHSPAQYQGGRPHPPPIMPATARAAPPPPPAAPAPAKQSPDPVIQMLASRASSDAELKALMKIVATGNANQEQLRIFQRHIDELTAMINANKAQPVSQTHSPAPSHHNPTSRPPSAAPVIKPHPATVQPHPPIYPTPQQQYQHQPPPPPRYPSYPIVLEFQGQGASPDRFRFPDNTILEFLNSYKMLASFLVIRKGRDISPQLDRETEYYEPVTMTISVPEGRSAARDVLQFITRCVKPADQVRTYMTDMIEKCTRAPTRHLAFRLPYKSGIVETEEEAPVVQEVKPKPKPAPRKKKEDKDIEQGAEKTSANAVQDTPDATEAPPAQQVPAPNATQVAPTSGPIEASSNPEQGASTVEAPAPTPQLTSAESAPAVDAPVADGTTAKRKKSVRISEVPQIASDGTIAPNPAVAPDGPATTT
ncbi:hypothetical protein D6D29_04055 [Aureobasidium pullulans]|nr:hypothetical protein D6D29_04055 [Aureobasidium pullulans]